MIWGWIVDKGWPFILAGMSFVVIIFLSKQNGALRIRAKNAEETNQTLEGMRDAVAKTPTDRASVARRLRDGRF